MEPRLIYVTTANAEEARTIGRALVESRLAACANVLSPVTSIFWWEGAVQEEPEVVLIAKTRRSLVESVVEKVKALHSYDCPCVVALPILEGNPDFLRWIGEETTQK